MITYQSSILEGEITYCNTWPVHFDEAPAFEKDRTHVQIVVLTEEGRSTTLLIPKTTELLKLKKGDKVLLEKRSFIKSENYKEFSETIDYLQMIFGQFLGYGNSGDWANYTFLNKKEAIDVTLKRHK